MEIKDIKLSIKQISEMRHALGNNLKNPYRNYFNTGIDDFNWDQLVELGFATKRKTDKEMGGVYYHVSDIGIKMLKLISKEE